MRSLAKEGLYSIFLNRLEEVKTKCRKEIIPFPHLFQKLCSNFSLTKVQCWDILFMLKEVGAIEIVPYHGVKLCNENI